MTKKQLSYQTNAVNFAIEHLQKHQEFKLQSPTGSGKTFIISKIIDQYLENDILNIKDTSFLFIAPSTGSLDFQGYEKITSYLKKDWVKGYSTQYIGTSNKKGNNKSYLQNIDYFEPDKVYFIGWQMFKAGTRITEIDSEKNDIYKVINNTKNKDINIVLIIDEAHREVYSSKDSISVKNEILEILEPYKTIKVSATLEQNKEKPNYKITYDDVRSESSIKQNVVISSLNQWIKNIDKYSEEEQLIISAIEKQKQIKEAYKKNKIDFNPLILIQIPDGKNIEGEKTDKLLLNKIDNLLVSKGYKKGFNYSVWLDKDKTIKDKDQLVDNKSSIDILIFKQAIATGWDIPRANILVRIRDSKKDSFNIQTLGRIIRNPFFKYYDNELIDNAFVFTNDQKYKDYIKEEKIVSDEKEYVVVKRSKVAQNSNFAINKILIKTKNFDDEELVEEITKQIINFKDFYHFFQIDNDETLIENIKISSRLAVERNANKIEKEVNKEVNKNVTQPQLRLINNSKITLFDLYIKFRTITKSSNFIQQVLDNIALKVWCLDKTIKQFYRACIFNWNKTIWSINGNNMSLKDYIDYLRNNYITQRTTNYIEEYHLPKEYKVSKSKYDVDNWDGINSFSVKLLRSSLDSNMKENFIKNEKNPI